MRVFLRSGEVEAEISDRNVGYSPDVLEDWSRRLCELVITVSVAELVVDAQDE